MAQQIGEIAQRIGQPDQHQTDSKPLAIVGLTLDALRNLPARLDDSTLAMVKATATSPLSVLSGCDDETFAKTMRILSILPRRGDDEVTGELRLRIYQRKLGHYPAHAIGFLCSEALECRFFPSIAECLAIIARWERFDDASRAKTMAGSRYRSEIEQRMDEALTALRNRSLGQPEIDALPERWKLIAVERGYLRHVGDGGFDVRHGPVQPEQASSTA